MRRMEEIGRWLGQKLIGLGELLRGDVIIIRVEPEWYEGGVGKARVWVRWAVSETSGEQFLPVHQNIMMY